MAANPVLLAGCDFGKKPYTMCLGFLVCKMRPIRGTVSVFNTAWHLVSATPRLHSLLAQPQLVASIFPALVRGLSD